MKATAIFAIAAAFAPVALSAADLDGDHMDDAWEAKYYRAARTQDAPTVSPFRYDAGADPDSDGWSNFAEFQAGTDPMDAESRPKPPVNVRLTMLRRSCAPLKDAAIVLEAYPTNTEISAVLGAPMARWEVSSEPHMRMSGHSARFVVTNAVGAASEVGESGLKAGADGLREGAAIFVAFADVDGGGTYTPGEPYGCTVAEVGWAGADVEIELTETTDVIARMDLRTLTIAPQPFYMADQLTDRGVKGTARPGLPAANLELTRAGTNLPPTEIARVRVVRAAVNGLVSRTEGGTTVYEPYTAITVLDRMVNLAAHLSLTEADVLAGGSFDLDWGGPVRVWAGGVASLTNVSYRIVVGEGPVWDSIANQFSFAFNNVFEYGTGPSITEPLSPSGGKVFSRPVFRWRHDSPIGKSYPAFQLGVWRQEGAARILVYDTGIQAAPPRSPDGVYTFSPPLWPGAHTPQGGFFDSALVENGDSLESQTYLWAVSMRDSKFFGTAWDSYSGGETNRAFGLYTVSAEAARRTATLDVDVELPGGSATNCPFVADAYETPDFRGVPAGRGEGDLAESGGGVLSGSCRILGLVPGRTYYIRAHQCALHNDLYSYETKPYNAWGYYSGPAEPPESGYSGKVRPVVLAPSALVATNAAAWHNPALISASVTNRVAIVLKQVDADNDGWPDDVEARTQDEISHGPVLTGGN